MGVLKYSETGRAPWRVVDVAAVVAEAAGMEYEAVSRALRRAEFPAVARRATLYEVDAAVRFLRGRPGKGRRGEARTK